MTDALTRAAGPSRLRLWNGWTVSLSENDTPPALCSVAAWPSGEDEAVGVENHSWFQFRDGTDNCRCFSVAAILRALAEIASAPPPTTSETGNA